MLHEPALLFLEFMMSSCVMTVRLAEVPEEEAAAIASAEWFWAWAAAEALRHCLYAVLDTSSGRTKMMRKEKYQAISTDRVTTRRWRIQLP